MTKKKCSKQANCIFKSNKSCTSHSSKVSRFARLAVLSSLAKVQSLPTNSMGSELTLYNKLKHHVNHMGMLDTKQLTVPKLDSLKDYLINEVSNKEVLEGAVSYIVDSGCACSCMSFKEDFESLQSLPHPIILKGVTGEQKCMHGGIIKLQCINDKGEVVTLKTPGYYNPHQVSDCLVLSVISRL